MVMVPPMDNTDAVVNVKVVIPVVVRCATLSPAASVIATLVTCPPIAGDKLGELTTSALVATDKPVETDSLCAPVVSCPSANVMICGPGGSTAPAVVHTMVRVAGVMAHPDNVARPDPVGSAPTGGAGPVK